jgi:hypothetical protein
MTPDAARIAEQRTRQAVLGIVRDTGGPMTTRPVVPGAASTVRDAEAMAGLRAAADVEHQGRQLARHYIRHAREEGASWAAIGAALGLADDDDHDPIAAAAFDYAADPDSSYARTYGQSFTWHCPVCNGLISDHGPEAGSPADQERGHASGCARLASDVAAYEAAWGNE